MPNKTFNPPNPKKTPHVRSKFAQKLADRYDDPAKVRRYFGKLLDELGEGNIPLEEAVYILKLADIFIDEYGKIFNIMFENVQNKTQDIKKELDDNKNL